MNKKKLLALLMALVMTLTLVPVTALAEEINAANAVAEVLDGETHVSYHGSLQDAIDAANEENTVKLLDDIVLNSSDEGFSDRYGFSIGKSITIDGNGNSITSGVFDRIFLVDENTTVSMKNLTVNNCKVAAGDTKGTACVFTWNSAEVCFENVTLDTTGHATGWNQPLTISGDGNVKTKVSVNGCTIKTNDEGTDYYAIFVASPADISVDNSTIKGWACVYLKPGAAGSTVSIKRSNLVSKNIYSGTSNRFSAIQFEAPNVNVTVESSTIVIAATGDQLQGVTCFAYGPDTTGSVVTLGEGNKISLTDENATLAIYSGNYHSSYNINGKVAVSGGLFSEPVDDAYCAEGYICVANTDPETKDAYPYMVKQGIYVAQIGDVTYETLKAAIDAVPANTETTITMIGNETIEGNAGVTIPSNANIVLDLNGHTVKNAVNESKASQVITNKGTLTIKDSAGNGLITNAVQEGTEPGEWWSSPQRNYFTNVITNNGTLTVKSGTIRQTAAGSICYAVDNISGSYDAILNVEGGLITDDYGTVIRQFCNSTTKKNEVNIKDGVVSTTGYAALWIQLPGSDKQAKMASLNVTGGTLQGGSYAFYDYSFGDVFDAVEYHITDGKFGGEIYSYGVEKFISGGVFHVEPTAAYIADGYAAMANEDAETNKAYPYKVAKMTASVSETKDVDVTVDQKSEIVAPIDAYTTATSSLGTAAAVTVSGVVLTADKTVTVGDVSKSGIQAVVDEAAKNDTFSQKLEDADRVEIEVNVKVKPETYVVQEQTKTATFDLTPYATVKTFDGNEHTGTSGEIKVSNDMIDQSQPILVKLYTNFEPQLLLHVGENFSETITKGTYPSLEEFSYENGYCYLYINHFSDIHALYSTSSVASIGATYYDTLAAAFAAAEDGDTINVLKDSSGAGIVAAQGKFPTGLTVNFNGHTYTVNDEPLAGSAGTKTQAFQLLKGNKITFENGAIVGDNTNVKMLIQNYADLTLNSMTLDATQGDNSVNYVLSTNNGNTVINDTTIKAKANGTAFDACSGWGHYASNSVSVTGTSQINGNVEVSYYGEDGTTPATLTLTSGTLNGNIVAGEGFASTTVTKKIEFNNAVPESYEWVDNGNGTSTLRRKAEVNFEGGSLRKRRIIDTEDEIVYNETDLRFGFTVYLPKGAVIDNDKSCFTWYKGDDSTNSRTVKMKKVQDIDDVTHVSNLVLNKVTSANFNTELHCMLKVVYTLNNTEYTIYSANEDPNAASDNYWNTRSVHTVADGLTGDWAAYAEQLQYVQ